MTEEQIKQNAEEYANSMRLSTENPPSDYHIGIYDGYIAGAHSRDEEIEQLKKAVSSAQKAMAELAEMIRNPRINVTDKLPEEN